MRQVVTVVNNLCQRYVPLKKSYAPGKAESEREGTAPGGPYPKQASKQGHGSREVWGVMLTVAKARTCQLMVPFHLLHLVSFEAQNECYVVKRGIARLARVVKLDRLVVEQ